MRRLVVHENSLSAVLSEFAETMLTDFRIQAILDHLVERIVDVLPLSGAGVTLITPGVTPQYVAASGEAALRFERLQTKLGQGPCLVAHHSGEPVLIPDLAVDATFPQFGPAALAAGLAAVFAFPLGHGDGRLGALDLYRDSAAALAPDDVAAAQTLANVAAAYLLNANAREQAIEARDRFQESALHDALTGLPNRMLLAQRLEHAAARAQRSRTTAAVLFADLDRFKQVNDTHGHAVGDGLLIDVAARLSALVRPGDTLARISGDEFVILCEDLGAPADAESLAARIDHAFAAPFAVNGIEIVVSASVGIAYSGPGQAITHQLVSDADAAMYEAKRRRSPVSQGGRGSQGGQGGQATAVIDLRESTERGSRNNLSRDLRTATAAGSLDVAYQPIVRTADGLVTGVEALLRWTHPVLGQVPALTAVALAERDGLIHEMGAWVLQRACRDRVRWLREHPERPLDMSVNVSVRQLMARDFRDTVAAVLAATGMDPTALVLEITEGILLSDTERASTVLADLRAQGVRLALDDFGTGYSSLSYLRQFPVDIVKIDQGFTATIGREPVTGAIVAAITQLAHVLGMTVTAEGVETQQQRDELVSIGCEAAQGYHYARPMSGADVCAQLAVMPGRPLHLPGGLRNPRGSSDPATPKPAPSRRGLPTLPRPRGDSEHA